jgi:hypothetical protein
MKFSTSIVLLATMASAAAMSVTNKVSAKAKVLRASRRLDGNQQEEEEYGYLAKYNLKMVSCSPDTTVIDPETGDYEYSAVVFRLCPTESGCDSDTAKGCGAGYGDYVVGMNTFVNAFFEDQRDNMNWDDQFKVDEYAECREYEIEADEDGDDGNQVQYFIGPTCAESGNDIALAVFEDEGCATKSETAFETLSNGWTLPYEDGGLISVQCLDCIQYNDDGAYELREMCQQLYESTAYKCETNMEYYSYYGQNTQGCEQTAALMPITKKSGNGGKVFGWIIFMLVVAGLVGYVMWWRKKKAGGSDGIMS